MPRYIVQSSHTAEECLKSLDEFLAQGEDKLAMWDFGCAAGDHSNHTAYSTLQAPDEASARSMMPGTLRPQARISEVGKFTGDQVRSFHKN